MLPRSTVLVLSRLEKIFEVFCKGSPDSGEPFCISRQASAKQESLRRLIKGHHGGFFKKDGNLLLPASPALRPVNRYLRTQKTFPMWQMFILSTSLALPPVNGQLLFYCRKLSGNSPLSPMLEAAAFYASPPESKFPAYKKPPAVPVVFYNTIFLLQKLPASKKVLKAAKKMEPDSVPFL